MNFGGMYSFGHAEPLTNPNFGDQWHVLAA